MDSGQSLLQTCWSASLRLVIRRSVYPVYMSLILDLLCCRWLQLQFSSRSPLPRVVHVRVLPYSDVGDPRSVVFSSSRDIVGLYLEDGRDMGSLWMVLLGVWSFSILQV